MSCQSRRAAVICSLTLVVLIGSVAAQGQPRPILGQATIEQLVTVDLNDVGLPGTSVAQRVTIDPLIKTADHTHTARTSLLIMISGTISDVRGTTKRLYGAGDVVAVPEGVTHHVENGDVVPAVYIEVNTTAAKH